MLHPAECTAPAEDGQTGPQEITNMVLNVPASSDSEWSEDYLPKFACDAWRRVHWSIPETHIDSPNLSGL